MLALPPNQVHLWLVFGDEPPSQTRLAEYRRLMTEDERRQEQRFRLANDRHRYLITRALVRTVLSRYSAQRPDYWRFDTNAFGRPELLNGVDVTSTISFNLSHTNGLILCAISLSQAVGVDVEDTRRKPASLEIAERFFSPDEVNAIRAFPPGLQSERFFYYWTLKESYVKARGIGLSMSLNQFSFSFPGERCIRMAFHANLDDFQTGSQYWLLQPSSEHIAAVCVQRMDGASQQLVMRKVTPLDIEEPFNCDILRESCN